MLDLKTEDEKTAFFASMCRTSKTLQDKASKIKQGDKVKITYLPEKNLFCDIEIIN